MTTIKKKDLKKYTNKPKEELDELVDVDGSPIEGDRNATNDSEIEVAPQQTTDDFVNQAVQPNRNLSGYAGTGYQTRRVGESKAEELVRRIIESDMNANQVPDIQELSKSKPIVAHKAQEIVDTIGKNNLDGIEIAAMLGFILSNIDMNNIPEEFRQQLRSKI